MNHRQRKKKLLKYVPRRSTHEATYNGEFRPRDKALYYKDYCCKDCYFDWGRWFEKRHMYKHEAARSNYEGLLKKYWVPVDYYKDIDDEYTEADNQTPAGNQKET